jgi:putative transposase
MVRYANGRGVGMRRGSALLRVSRSMCTYDRRKPVADAALCQRIRELSSLHPAWGYRLIHGWLREQGETSSLGRVRRLWKKLGLAALWRRKHRKIKRGIRLNPPAVAPNSVWCMDFSEDRLQNGRKFFSLLVKDEATAFGLEIAVASSFKARDVERVLDQLVATYGKPQYARCDNGGQFIAYAVQMWAERRGVRMAYIDPGKPWQNGSAESFVGTYRREVLDAEVFFTMKEATVLSQQWKTMYNTERPHSRHGYRPPAKAYNKRVMTNEEDF